MNDEALPDDQGRSLHISGLFVGFVSGLPQLFFPIAAALVGTRASSSPQWIPIVIIGVMLGSLFFRWLTWTRFRYFVGEHDIRIEKGLLSRNARSIPYERIQDVSIEQKPLARILGLGEVKFETGGGEGDDAKLSFVSVADAEDLRELVRARKAGAKLGTVEVEQAIAFEDQPPLFAMDGKRVFIFGLYSFSLVIFAVVGGIAQQLDFLLPFDFWDIGRWLGVAKDRGVDIDSWSHISIAARVIFGLAALLSLIVLGLATGVIRTILSNHGFRLDRTEKGFRRRRGLLTLTDVVMPVHRVQAAIIQTGPIRKRRGWHALKLVSLAQESKEETNYVAAPFARMDEIWPIAATAMIRPPQEGTAIRRGMAQWWVSLWMLSLLPMLASATALTLFAKAGAFSLLPLLVSIPLALLFWFNWRRYADAVDGNQLYVRHGWWRERLTIAPQVKIQSVQIAQGPIARRFGLAALHFGIAGGNLEMVALPVATARAIRDAVLDQVVAVDYSAINKSG